MKPKKRLYFHPKTGKKITKAEYDKYLSKAKGGKIKYQEGGPAKRAQAAWEKSTGKKMKTPMTDAETILSLIMGTMGGGKMPFKGGYGPIKGTIAKGAYTRDPSHVQKEAAKVLKKHKDVIDKATKSSDKIRNKYKKSQRGISKAKQADLKPRAEEYRIQDQMDRALGRSNWDEYTKGGPIPKMEAVKRLVEMWKPKTKEGKLYDAQLARAVMALGGQVPEYGLGGSLLGGMLGKGKSVMGLLGGPAGLALSKLFGGKQQKGGMSAKQLAQQKMAEAQTEGLAEETQDANRENIMNALMYSTSPDQMNQTNQIPLKKKGMFDQGGAVPAGRRMYGTKKKKKSLQTADIGPVRGFKKGGSVKYHV